MAEELTTTDSQTDSQTEAQPGSTPDLAQPVRAFDDIMQCFIDTAHVDTVFGEPVQVGSTTIIPAAEVLGVLGFGMGFGSGTEREDEEQESGQGGGMGGGGRTLARPVAAIIAGPDGVRVEPIIDKTKVALAAITAAGFMLAMLLRLIRPQRALREMKRD